MGIRQATDADLSAILEIYNEAIRETTAVYHYEEKTLDERQEWFAEKMANGEPVIVFEKETQILGFATFGIFRPWPAFKYSIEHSIYVADRGRGEGIGSTLLASLIQLASAEGYKTIVAGIDADNPGSLRLHEKLGFTQTGLIRNAGYKFGRWLDLAFYQLDLPGPLNPVER